MKCFVDGVERWETQGDEPEVALAALASAAVTASIPLRSISIPGHDIGPAYIKALELRFIWANPEAMALLDG